MNLTIGYPEFMLASATALLVTGTTLPFAYTLFGLSMFTAFARYALELQARAQANKELEESIEGAKNVAGSVATFLAALNTSPKNDSNLH